MKKQRLLFAWALLSVASLQAAVSSTKQLNKVIRLVKSLQTTGALTTTPTTATPTTATPTTATPWADPATFAALQAAIPKLSFATSVTSKATPSSAPASFNINIGSAGYAFFTNPWFGTDPVVPGLAWSDISSYLSSGLSLVLLGFDKNMNLILDFTKQFPAKMKLLIYNTNTGALIKSVSFDPMSSRTLLPAAAGTAIVVNSNAFSLGGFDIIGDFPDGTYPVAFDITFPQVTPAAVKIYSIPATFKALQVAIPSMTVASSTASTASSTSVPTSFNINVGSNVGYAFFENPWNVSDAVVPGFAWSDISSYLSDGTTFVLLGFDKNMNVILDFTKQAPTAMSLLIYDTKTGELITSVPFDPINSGTVLSGTSIVVNSNGISVGELDLASVPSGTYPVAFPIMFGQTAPATTTPAAPTPAPSGYNSYDDYGFGL